MNEIPCRARWPRAGFPSIIRVFFEIGGRDENHAVPHTGCRDSCVCGHGRARGGGFGDQQFVVPQSMNDPQVRKANALHDWRVEELKLQTADGGALTPQHRKYLQARLAAIRAGEY